MTEEQKRIFATVESMVTDWVDDELDLADAVPVLFNLFHTLEETLK